MSYYLEQNKYKIKIVYYGVDYLYIGLKELVQCGSIKILTTVVLREERRELKS